METTKFKYQVPPTRKERKRLRDVITLCVHERSYSPPLSMDGLAHIALEMMAEHQLATELKGWLMVELNNAIWLDTVAAIPYEKRLLLLPKCLRNAGSCKADIDDLGLLCNLCGGCTIPDLQTRAEELGMMSMVAEGFTSVIGLVESGMVDAVVGVSCLHALEKAFPLLINHAVPGLAIPLNEDGCKDTTVDEEYVYSLMTRQVQHAGNLLDYEGLKLTIKNWFRADNLRVVLSVSNDQTSLILRDWMSGDGKRWRPYLLTATYMALTGSNEIPEMLQRAAIAIECFHKASLVHDDIEDDDVLRYGKETVNAAYGVSVAINVGDMYLGEGYRLLADCENIELIKVASKAHIALCKGQGMEMEWTNNRQVIGMEYVLDIFCHKTVPAFDVALLMGAICAGSDETVRNILSKYAKALGIAYQLRDDVEDFENDNPLSIRPSAVLAVLCELNSEAAFVQALLHKADLKVFLNQNGHDKLLQTALTQVQTMVEDYRKQAFEVIDTLQNVELKRLLFRVTKKILK